MTEVEMAGWHHRLDGHEFGSSDSKTSASSIPGSGRSPGEGDGNPLQHSCLENPMDRSLAGYNPWGHKSQTRLSN